MVELLTWGDGLASCSDVFLAGWPEAERHLLPRPPTGDGM